MENLYQIIAPISLAEGSLTVVSRNGQTLDLTQLLSAPNADDPVLADDLLFVCRDASDSKSCTLATYIEVLNIYRKSREHVPLYAQWCLLNVSFHLLGMYFKQSNLTNEQLIDSIMDRAFGALDSLGTTANAETFKYTVALFEQSAVAALAPISRKCYKWNGKLAKKLLKTAERLEEMTRVVRPTRAHPVVCDDATRVTLLSAAFKLQKLVG